VIRKLEINAVYLPKRQKKALEAKVDFLTYFGKAEETALIDSSATENCIDFKTVERLKLGTQELLKPQFIINVDGTRNSGGTIEHCVHLYVTQGQKEECLKFYITNLRRDRMILGFPWLATFNPEINWAEGQIKGPKIQLKTTALVAKEHEETAISLRRMVLENIRTMRIWKVTIAQQMAEKHYDKEKVNTESTIPKEYQRHAKVFSEQEAM
jgi:hypothetical protein